MTVVRSMEFLVRITIEWPTDASEEKRLEVVERESVRAAELADSGHLVRLWRTADGWGNVGVWSATEATELQGLLSSLPLYPWMHIDIEPLANHPSDPAARDHHDR